MKKKAQEIEVLKVDSDLGVIFGWGMICKEDGKDYYDSHGDHLPEDVMLESVCKFMEGARVAKVMHKGDVQGQVLFGFPMTEDIAEALGIEVEKSGFIIGMKPDNDDILEKFASGEYTGFSLGGTARMIENA